MKDARMEKLALKLSASEQALRDRLLALLPNAAESGALLFMNSEFNAFALPAHQLVAVAEELLSQARECVSLRQQLSEPVEDSVGWLYLQACEEGASSNEHRRGPKRLAAWLLERLRNAA